MRNYLDADYWRKLADEARELAKGIRDEENRRRMLRVAADYDELAERAQQRAIIRTPRSK